MVRTGPVGGIGSAPPAAPSRPEQDGTPKVDPKWVKAVVGHMYVIHVVDDTRDFYALFRVDQISKGDTCTISWQLVPAPGDPGQGLEPRRTEDLPRAAAQGIQAGLLGGVTTTGLSNLGTAIDFGVPVEINRNMGAAVGPFVAFPVSRSVALQVEALFATRGATPTEITGDPPPPGHSPPLRRNFRLTYLDLPVLVRLTPRSLPRVYFLAGPSFNINLSAKAIDTLPAAEADLESVVRNGEVGVVLAAGVTEGRLLVEARYSAGLTDVTDSPAITAPVRTRAFAVVVGVRFK
jgi:hypothetical protein